MGKEDLAGILVARCICIDAFALMKACVISVFMICIWEKQVKGSNTLKNALLYTNMLWGLFCYLRRVDVT